MCDEQINYLIALSTSACTIHNLDTLTIDIGVNPVQAEGTTTCGQVNGKFDPHSVPESGYENSTQLLHISETCLSDGSDYN